MKLIEKLLVHLPKLNASDLHIAAGMPPMVRHLGKIRPVSPQKIPAAKTKEIILDILTPEQKTLFEKNMDLDFCYSVEGVGRFRANILNQKDGVNGVFRFIPPEIPDPAKLGLNDTIISLSKHHQGLVLVTGGTRNGKTTTLAALVQEINRTEDTHIITVEDPIEFIYPKGKAVINQREVGTHTKSTHSALRAALREDPDIIIVGEMRDAETIELAVSASETGHLVISTLQTKSAAKTIDRVIDSFPAGQAGQIRSMLSESIRGIVSQQLVPRKDGKGMVLAAEILLNNMSLGTLIREGKTYQIPSVMQTGKAQGMKKMDDALLELFKQDLITKENLLRFAHEPKKLIATIPGGDK